MECARQGCDKEAIAASNYCKAHFDLDKVNVDSTLAVLLLNFYLFPLYAMPSPHLPHA